MGMAGPIFEPHLYNFENDLFFEDKQMILLPLFDIYTGFRFTKNLNSCSIQFWSHPWLVLPYTMACLLHRLLCMTG